MKKILCLMGLMGLLVALSGCAKPKDAAILLTSDKGSCSGEQVEAPSGETYVLTAGHCAVLADKDGNIKVTLESGKSLMRRVIAEDPNNDLLLLEGVPGLKGLKLALSSKDGDHVYTLTHGKGMKLYRTDGQLIQKMHIQIPVGYADACPAGVKKYEVVTISGWFGELSVCTLSVDVNASTAKVVPGSSGGMILNDSDELVGVVSAGDEDGFGYFVPAESIQAFLSAY